MAVTGSRLMRFSRRFQQYYAARFLPLLEREALTMREIHVLLFLANSPELDTARDVSEYRGLAKSQVSQAVEVLAARDILRRVTDGGDRRVVHLAITETGLPIAREAQAIQADCGRVLLEGLGEAEREQFLCSLEKVFAQADLLMKGESPS